MFFGILAAAVGGFNSHSALASAPPSAASAKSQNDQTRTALIFQANITKNAVVRSNINDQRLYQKLDAEVAAKQDALKKLGISEAERRRLKEEIAELRAQQDDLIRQLEQKDLEYSASIRAFREGVDGLFQSKDPGIIAALARYAAGDLTALDQVQELSRIQWAAREAGTRAHNGEEARGVAFLIQDARDKGQKTTRQLLEAWQDAARVDPDVAGTWVEIARLQFQLGNLDEAAKTAEHAKQISTDLIWRSAALDELGAIAIEQGRLTDAEAIQKEGLELARQVEKELPSDLRTRLAVSIALIKLGDVQAYLGKNDEAERSYLDALEIRERKQAEFPQSQYAYRELGVILSRIARFKLRLRDVGAAKVYSDRSLIIFDRLLTMNPGNTFARFDKDIAMRMAADVAVLEDRIDDALDLLAGAVTLNLSNWEADPLNEVFRREVAVTFDQLISTELSAGHFDAALRDSERYVTFAKKLMREDPSLYASRVRLAVAFFYKGQALQALGRKSSTVAYTESLQVLDDIERDHQSRDQDQKLRSKLQAWMGAGS